MKTLIQAVVVTLFVASTAQAQQAVQWRVEDGGNGHWYRPSSSPTTWMQAMSSASSVNGHLATITSAAENQFLAGLNLPSNGGTIGYWIGGVRASAGAGAWGWVTGEDWSYSNFDPSEPNGCCGTDVRFTVFRSSSAGGWDDTSSENVQFSIIEWSADCNNDGIVDYGQCRDGSLPDYNGNNIPDCCESGTACIVGNYPVQWRVSDGGNGHWYQFVIAQTMSWDAARAAASTKGGYLASVTSLQESDFVVAACSDTAGWVQFSFYWLGPWLGGYQPPNSTEPDGGWTWVSGEPWDWTRWWPGSGEPNNGCSGHENYLVMLTQSPLSGPSGWWNDAAYPDACGGPSPISYLVEWSADCNNDGIIDHGQILQGQLADTNQDGIPDICQQPTCVDADFFRDFTVNGADLGILLSQWGATTPLTVSDLNSDGTVDGVDLGLFLSFWGPCH